MGQKSCREREREFVQKLVNKDLVQLWYFLNCDQNRLPENPEQSKNSKVKKTWKMKDEPNQSKLETIQMEQWIEEKMLAKLINNKQGLNKENPKYEKSRIENAREARQNKIRQRMNNKINHPPSKQFPITEIENQTHTQEDKHFLEREKQPKIQSH